MEKTGLNLGGDEETAQIKLGKLAKSSHTNAPR